MAKKRRKSRKKKVSNIKEYRRPLNLNIGMVIFAVIFFYVIICVIMYFQTSHIVRYEVQEGSLATDTIYRGVVLRDETVVSAEAAGYVNYYAREGERVARNNLVYIIDETGRLNEELESLSLGENSLSDKELAEFRSEIVNFVHGFDETHYSDTYDFKYSLKNTVLKLANTNMLQSVSDLNGASGGNVINYFYAPDTGIVTYWTDGYEGLQAQDVTAEIWDNEDTYEKKQLMGNTLVASGDPVYKLSTSEDWSIVIPIDPERGAQLQEEGFVKVRFLKNQYESWGEVKLLTNSDGNTYLQLTFSNSMVTFSTDRFLDVELIVEDETGLKIPVSSIVQKEFFLIPEDFVIPGGNNGGDSIIRQCFLEDGTISSELVEIEVYYYDSESKEYYLDSSVLSSGENLYKLDSQETFTVSKRATLIGVYNINKGYADFKQITILDSNDEYAIVKPNTRYGLSVYDYIVLNAESVRDDQFINQ
ncbi:MAG: hypothetical protein HFH92_03735 [Lachnospiraceae bacterium]|uniref:HlyD family efflux transporter periplasmic adaptor subunit n=1 Tax=uncultured Acetatifactor sp. TaxID=1671927 RepID=UPI00262BE744|nr:HlyD family efflux transporter periplasmic adaptor subunit [uncultured Acetatifactor sp.]MCI8788216.1 hypothetical protein [Lachnospiraceae bacterium]